MTLYIFNMDFTFILSKCVDTNICCDPIEPGGEISFFGGKTMEPLVCFYKCLLGVIFTVLSIFYYVLAVNNKSCLIAFDELTVGIGIAP